MKTPFAAPYPFEMFDRVGHEDLLARDSRLSQCLVKQTSRGSDEGTALPVFLVSGLLSDKHHARSCRSFAEDRLCGVLVEITAFARLCRETQSLECAPFLKKVPRGYSRCLLYTHCIYRNTMFQQIQVLLLICMYSETIC
jgi:hypothetical protein